MSGTWSNSSLPEPVREAFASLQNAFDGERLAHGYVVSGPSMPWCVLLARLMLQRLFCEQDNKPCGECRGCQLVDTRRHSDIQWLEPEKKSRVIGIDPVREANHVLRQTSYEGGWKAAVLVDADRMNESAANAFLKTLEEPPERCLLLLLTCSPQALLPTIWSRCQHVPIGAMRAGREVSRIEEAMLDWLHRRSGVTAALEQAAWIATILREVRDQAEADEKERATDETDEDVINARVMSRVVGARTEVLRIVYQWERDILACAQGAGAETLYYPDYRDALTRQGAKRSLAAQLNRLDRVDRARRLLEGNVPDQAVWEAVLPA